MVAPRNDTQDRSRPPGSSTTPNGRESRPRPPGPEERRGATATSGGNTPKPPTLMDSLRSPRFWITLVVLGVLYFFIIPVIFPANSDRVTVSYTFFKDQVTKKNVGEITSQGETIQGLFKQAVPDPNDTSGGTPKTYTKFTTQIPAFADPTSLEPLLAENGVQITAKPLEEPRSTLITFLFTFGPTVLLIVGFVWL